MAAIKVYRIVSPLILGAAAGIVGGGSYHKLTVDGLIPNQIGLKWHPEIPDNKEGSPLQYDTVTVSQSFEGLGMGEVSGKLSAQGRRQYWRFPPLPPSDSSGSSPPPGYSSDFAQGYSITDFPSVFRPPKEAVFYGTPKVRFESEHCRNESNVIVVAGILAGVVSAFRRYCRENKDKEPKNESNE